MVKMTTNEKNNIFVNFKNKINVMSQQKSLKYGVPFLLLIVGGSFVLKEWTQIRYQFSTNKSISNEEAEKMGLRKSRKVSLETAYEEIQQLDIDNWENKRGPRPWEEQTQVQQ